MEVADFCLKLDVQKGNFSCYMILTRINPLSELNSLNLNTLLVLRGRTTSPGAVTGEKSVPSCHKRCKFWTFKLSIDNNYSRHQFRQMKCEFEY